MTTRRSPTRASPRRCVTPISHPRRRMRCTCHRISSPGSGCGRNRPQPTGAPPPRRPARPSGRTLDYLVYASLQLARDKDAAAALEEARQVTGAGATAGASVYARAAIPARQMVERGLWQEAAKLDDPDKSSFPFTEAMRYFGRALGAARS